MAEPWVRWLSACHLALAPMLAPAQAIAWIRERRAGLGRGEARTVDKLDASRPENLFDAAERVVATGWRPIAAAARRIAGATPLGHCQGPLASSPRVGVGSRARLRKDWLPAPRAGHPAGATPVEGHSGAVQGPNNVRGVVTGVVTAGTPSARTLPATGA